MWTMWAGVPDAARLITLVFWTRSPKEEWVPPCSHFHPQPEMGSDDFPFYFTGSESQSDSCESSDGYDLTAACHFTSWMMRDLAGAVIRSRGWEAGAKRITVVNAAAFQPPNCHSRKEHVEALRSGEVSHESAEWHFHLGGDWHDFEHKQDLDVQFLTMQDWIKTGEWEEAFSEAEMRPWLDEAGKE